MRAACWVCGWRQQVANLREAHAALRAHEAEAGHPRVMCPACNRQVPTHNGKFPDHYVTRSELTICVASGTDVSPTEAKC